MSGALNVECSKGMHSTLINRLKRSWWLAVASLAITGTGCERNMSPDGTDLGRNRLIAQARQLAQDGHYEDAAKTYRTALQGEARLASHGGLGGAHLELGLLYEQKLNDPVAAIYHYRQFLGLTPDTDQRQLAEGYVQRARLTLVAQLAQVPGAEPAEWRRLREERAALVEENTMLKGRLAELEKGVPSAAAAPSIPVAPASEPVRPKTHIVQKGETLQGIALRYYGTRAAWTRILEANTGVLTNRDQLKIGQELILP